MTVEYLGEIDGGRGTNNKGNRTYTRRFKLETSLKTEREYIVGSHASLPKIGSLHPADPGAWCQSVSIENSSPWKGWTYTAEYSSERELAENPLDDPAKITWDSEQFQRPVQFDTNGNAVCNSAGDPFDPPLMMDDSRRVVTVEKNLAVVPSWILTYQDAVNNDVFALDGISIGVGLAKAQRVSVGGIQERNSIKFRTVNLTIHLEKNGWLLEREDDGFRENVSSLLTNIRNSGDDELPGAPVPLNGAGAALNNPSAANNVMLSFTVYATLPFSILPLT